MQDGEPRSPALGGSRKAWLARTADLVLDWLFPARCAGCRRIFRPLPASGGDLLQSCLGRWLCPGCLAKTKIIDSPLCSRCGEPFPSAAGCDHLCGACITTGRPFGKARSVFVYQGPVRALIHDLKYHGQVKLARPLGRLLFQALRRYWALEDFDLAVPVPLHSSRERRRTYNQAWLLLQNMHRAAVAEGLAGLPFAIGKQLRRCRPTRPQAGLSRSRRRENIGRAFEVVRPDLIKGRRVLLVDDVMTTGATVEGCCRRLLQSGAANVDVLVLARVSQRV